MRNYLRKQRTFILGPFEIRENPRHFDNMYSLYEVFANDVPVRRQISYPEIEDGWLGVSNALPNVSKYLTTEQVEKLKTFVSIHVRKPLEISVTKTKQKPEITT